MNQLFGAILLSNFKIMSKLYDKYEILKNNNASMIYLFECGNFYIALDSDAIVMNEMFNLKLTKFSNVCDKCGFPKNALEKYKEQLNQRDIDYKVIEQTNISPENMLNSLRKLLGEYEFDKMDKEDLLSVMNQIKNLIGE